MVCVAEYTQAENEEHRGSAQWPVCPEDEWLFSPSALEGKHYETHKIMLL